MKHFFLTALFAALPGFAAAQNAPDNGRNNAPDDRVQIIIPGDGDPPTVDIPEGDIIPEAVKPEQPDYSKLSPKAERQARLNDLFAKLAAEEDAESANLVAEEIWAIWLDSGSASVNLILRRGSDAQAKGDTKLARRMYNHTTSLAPDYAEGWARSSRLALEEKNFNRAINEAITALTLEPRHFYALWTVGNVFEQLGRQDEALEAYREANELYPELKAVKDRLEELEVEVDGTVL